MSWNHKPLSEVAEFRLGKMLDAKKNRGELMPYLANVNVRWGEFDFSGLREMRFEEHEVEKFRLEQGDIVMCEGGEPGRCAIWNNQRDCMMIQKAIHRIRPHSCLDNRFLFYSFVDQGKSGVLQGLFTGSTIKHLPREKLALVEVPVPPIDVQTRIADRLSAYDDLIENNRRRMELLEASARHLYEEWFVRLRFPGHEHTHIKDGVPKGWEVRVVPDILAVNPRTKLADKPEHTWVEMSNLSTDSMVVQATSQREGRSGSKFQNGDTLVARITPCLENGKTAFVDFLKNGETARGSTEFIVFRPKSVSPEFVYCFARTYHLREHAIKSMRGSSGRQRVQESCFDEFRVKIPPPALQGVFQEIVSPMFKLVRSLHQQNAKLKAARDHLLPRLISGEVPV